MKTTQLWIGAAIVALFGFACGGASGEHPSGGAEHPREESAVPPETAPAGAAVTKENLAEAIARYVEKDAALKGGHFLFYDAKNEEPLLLTLDHVHKDRLSSLGNDVYFACADFRATNGKTYDIDVFMRGADAEHLEVTEIHVHKENGVARYTWHQRDDGTWERRSADGQGERASGALSGASGAAASAPASRPAGRRAGGEEHPAEHPSGGAEHPE